MSEKTKREVTELWRELREVINYTFQENESREERLCLRDYAENISWHDDLATLLGRESANEREHRKGRPSSITQPFGLSVENAAKLILLGNVATGAKMRTMPSALGMLQIRRTALEAEVIGFIVKDFLTQEWLDRVQHLDYVKAIRSEQ